MSAFGCFDPVAGVDNGSPARDFRSAAGRDHHSLADMERDFADRLCLRRGTCSEGETGEAQSQMRKNGETNEIHGQQ